ncbi:unnamed protein product [Caenorhabditis brenneri]
MIIHLETELQFAHDRLNSIYDDTTPKDITKTRDDSEDLSRSEVEAPLSSTSVQPPVNSTEQPPVNDLDGKVVNKIEEHEKLQVELNEMSAQLRRAQRFNVLLHFFAHRSNQLVREVEFVRRQLLNTEQERAYLRNHLHYVMMEKEDLGILLANANRQAVETREVDNLNNMLMEQRDCFQKLREENVRLKESIEAKDDEAQRLLEKLEKVTVKNEKVAQKNRQLQKLVEDIHGCWENASLLLNDSTATTPATPTTPETSRTLISPQSPYDKKPPMGQRKRPPTSMTTERTRNRSNKPSI